ncbi:MAG: hypothetical protein AAF841_04340 [Pseudomonadota bacterium]
MTAARGPAALHDALLAAHIAGDSEQMVDLYTQAADQSGTEDEEMFFLTHAYIFALEAGHPATPQLRDRLRLAGRIG